jgi:hypothetical protein
VPVRDFLLRLVIFSGLIFAVIKAAAFADENVPESMSYSLPDSALRGLQQLASDSDALILGEMHGTQEVPGLAATLLTPLHQLGYRTLALELPADLQPALVAWASGKNSQIPAYFQKELEDGRGNLQVLALIRQALAPPFEWKLICFDLSTKPVVALKDLLAGLTQSPPANLGQETTVTSEMILKLSLRRDADMGANFLKPFRNRDFEKSLVICGNLHARTARGDAPGDPTVPLWPSFANVVQSSRDSLRVRSVNVVPCSGRYFAMATTDDQPAGRGAPVVVRSRRQVREAEFQLTPQGKWNAELLLPEVTPATFLPPRK